MIFRFFRRIIAFFVFLCFISSCQTTGNFVLVKRKDIKEIQIKNPPFLEKTNEKFPLKSEQKSSDVTKIFTDKNADENLMASNDTRVISTAPNSRIIMPNIHLTYFLPDTIKNNRADTIKKNINKGETVLPKPEQKTDTRKIYDLSVIALIFNSLTTSFYLFNLIKFFFFHSGLTVMLGISLILPLIGVILAYLSQNKIKKENTKYKGLKISKAAIYIGLIPYGIVSLYYFIISIIEIVMAIWWIFYG